MKNLKRIKESVLGLAMAAVFGIPATAQDVVRLKLAHFLPTANGMHSDFMEPWARELEACSNGAVAVEIFPAAPSWATRPSSTTPCVPGRWTSPTG